jgi:O-antigen/teichoic acid export membrane protein
MSSERHYLLRAGSSYLLLQLGTMLGWGADSLIVAISRGASEVAVLAVATRLFQFASQPFAMINAPLWAAYADATVRNDTGFVRQTLKRSFLLSVFGTALLSAILMIVGPALASAWTHGTIIIPVQVLVLVATWTVIEAGGTSFSMYLNGTGIVREQAWTVAAFCVVALPLKLWAVSQAGISGLFAATILSYAVTVIVPYLTVFRRRLLEPIAEHTA